MLVYQRVSSLNQYIKPLPLGLGPSSRVPGLRVGCSPKKLWPFFCWTPWERAQLLSVWGYTKKVQQILLKKEWRSTNLRLTLARITYFTRQCLNPSLTSSSCGSFWKTELTSTISTHSSTWKPWNKGHCGILTKPFKGISAVRRDNCPRKHMYMRLYRTCVYTQYTCV